MTFIAYQQQIYAAGSAGRRPPRSVSWAELERRASVHLQRGPWGYIAGSAGSEATERANRAALDGVHIVPRMMRDVSVRSLRRSVLGLDLDAPVLLAPIGVQTLAHPDGELASARAAASLGIPFVASSAATYTMEQIAAEVDDAPRWYQLYWPRSREICASFVKRAEEAGYTAVVVTLDTWLLGWRPRDLTEAFLPFLWGEGTANYLQDPVFRASLRASPEDDPAGAIRYFQRQFANPSVTWQDLAWLRQQTDLPIVLKGIQHPDDAREAVAAGAAAVWVSNHGGRQVDGAIGSFAALGPVVAAVDKAVPVIFDSGIRSGADAMKALASGADLVALGRPYMWGLALGGEAGVREVIQTLLADLELNLALSGYKDIDELSPAALDTSLR
jgi:isopentenyl diphosphate isomerase/L-lactate dehydrogenase-like FMN-dependent dehydrogenase